MACATFLRRILIVADDINRGIRGGYMEYLLGQLHMTLMAELSSVCLPTLKRMFVKGSEAEVLSKGEGG